MEALDPLTSCQECGGKMIEVHRPNPARVQCEQCGHEEWFVWDPVIQPAEPEDERNGILYLENAGETPLEVARVVRTLDGIDSPSALNLVRSNRPEIGRRVFPRVWQLTQLQDALSALGARTTLERTNER